MVGSALIRALKKRGIADDRILTAPRDTVDLCNQNAVDDWMGTHKPDVIFLAAAKVGGIVANRDEPAAFLYDNLMIQSNVIHAAHRHQADKLVFLGSSCIYPKDAPQPITEDRLMTGPLEKTNDAYAIAKIAGIKLCQSYRMQYGADFISVMPCNLYGPGDYYDALRSHVIPAMLMKFDHAVQNGDTNITLWGTGTPLREFLYVDDCAEAILHAATHYTGTGDTEQNAAKTGDMSHINIGSGHEISIRDLAQMIASITGFDGDITFDPSMPDGVARKIMDSRKINALGWHPATPLEDGIKLAYKDYKDRHASAPTQDR